MQFLLVLLIASFYHILFFFIYWIILLFSFLVTLPSDIFPYHLSTVHSTFPRIPSLNELKIHDNISHTVITHLNPLCILGQTAWLWKPTCMSMLKEYAKCMSRYALHHCYIINVLCDVSTSTVVSLFSRPPL